MRKLWLIVLGLVAFAAASECVSAYILYNHYGRKHKLFQPKESATVDLLDRIAFKRRVLVGVQGGLPFVLDPLLGFALKPGAYRITESEDVLRLVFDLNIDAEGHRPTSYVAPSAAKRVFIAGDSSFFGWGINDESTFAWLLQTRLPGCRFVNLSAGSYSYVHTLLQLQNLQPAVGKDDVVILPYHPITNEFNAGLQSILEPMLMGYELQLGPADMAQMQYPYAALDAAGKVLIKRTPLPFPGQVVTTPKSMASDSALAKRTTIAVLDELRKVYPAHLLVTVERVDGDDPVFDYIRDAPIDYIDLRHAVEDGGDDTDMINGHPGPSWHHYAFEKITQTLLQRHLCD